MGSENGEVRYSVHPGLCSIFMMVCFLGFSSASEGKTLYVSADDPNDPGTGSTTDPFVRIQDAMDAAITGDVVLILPGVYQGSGNHDLDPDGKSILIRSVDPLDPNIVTSTVIDASGGTGHRGFFIRKGEDPNCVLSGLTILNGNKTNGGGIFISGSSPTIRRCVITNNTATANGGGILFNNSSSTVSHCRIMNNHAVNAGGGLLSTGGHVKIVNCIISDNASDNRGGGLLQGAQGKTTVRNCTLSGNKANVGGGILSLGEVDISNSILWSNVASPGAQIALEQALNPSEITVRYSDVQGGKAAVKHDPNDGTLLYETNNIDVDPLFVLFDIGGDPNSWDFHLQSKAGRWDVSLGEFVKDSATSECIDSGDPTLDQADELWPHGLRINMGAYGGTAQASMKGNPADFDINGIVDLRDFTTFSLRWQAMGEFIEDLDRNGKVEDEDLELFSENWLWQATE